MSELIVLDSKCVALIREEWICRSHTHVKLKIQINTKVWYNLLFGAANLFPPPNY